MIFAFIQMKYLNFIYLRFVLKGAIKGKSYKIVQM